MNTRLQQFLSAENISQAQFAETIGVARASISHILAGRNKPGFDFLESMIRHYPNLNFEWLLTGRGQMYNNMKTAPDAPAEPVSPLPGSHTDTLFPESEYRSENPAYTPLSRQNSYTTNIDSIKQEVNNQKTISKIIIFFSDGSFQEIE